MTDFVILLSLRTYFCCKPCSWETLGSVVLSVTLPIAVLIQAFFPFFQYSNKPFLFFSGVNKVLRTTSSFLSVFNRFPNLISLEASVDFTNFQNGLPLCSSQVQHHGWVCSVPQVNSTQTGCAASSLSYLTYREAEGPILIKHLWVYISSAESKKFSLKHCDSIVRLMQPHKKSHFLLTFNNQRLFSFT